MEKDGGAPLFIWETVADGTHMLCCSKSQKLGTDVHKITEASFQPNRNLLATRAVQNWFAYAVAGCPSWKYSAKATSWQGAFAEHRFDSI